MNYSQGPWKISITGGSVDNADGTTVAVFASNFISKKEYEANKKIILAAPEMLNLLAAVVNNVPQLENKNLFDEISELLKRVVL